MFVLNGGVIKTQEAGWQTFAVFLTVVAVGIFAYSFWPMLINILKTRNTSGINPRMFLFHCLAGLFFGLGAFCLLLSTTVNYASRVDLPIIGGLFTIHNLSVAAGVAKVLLMKRRHAVDASHYGISEYEHYKMYVLPALEKEKEEKERERQQQELNKELNKNN